MQMLLGFVGGGERVYEMCRKALKVRWFVIVDELNLMHDESLAIVTSTRYLSNSISLATLTDDLLLSGCKVW
jgi:hypothetical protein